MPPQPGGRAALALAQLRRSPTPLTRTEIATALGVARATLSEALNDLLATGLIREGTPTLAHGGRPAQTYMLDPDGGTVGIIDVGGSRTRVGLADLTGTLIDDALLESSVESGPTRIMGWAVDTLADMVERYGRDTDRLAIVVGLPGPVDFVTGEVVSPPIMSSWQGFDVKAAIRASLDAPIVIDNDVNLIALAEQRLDHPDSRVMLVIKLGTGIGGGLVINGDVLRGARGAAGDIGHTQSTRAHGAQCRCGHVGCVEAVAGGWALVQALEARGLHVTNVTDVARLVRDGEPTATSHVRSAARAVGQATAQAVSLLNPDTVVVAGELLAAGDPVIATIREGIYQHSLPLATRDLRLVPSGLGPLVGLRGGAQLGIDLLLGASPAAAAQSQPPEENGRAS